MKYAFFTAVITGSIGSSWNSTAVAAPADWAAWTSTTGSPTNQVSGTITTSEGSIAVNYTGEVFFAQINDVGTMFYSPGTPFISASVPNAPSRRDIIGLQGGGSTGVHELTFTPALKDPIMAIVSLGQPSFVVTYDFDVAFRILSFGPGYWGGPGTLNNIGGKRLTGVEGHGTIQFVGNVSSVKWTIPNPETWHGFTVGSAGPACPCDLNGDELVDDSDFVIFVHSYDIFDCLSPSMPDRCPSDFDGDSIVDDGDFVLFVLAYNEFFCPL